MPEEAVRRGGHENYDECDAKGEAAEITWRGAPHTGGQIPFRRVRDGVAQGEDEEEQKEQLHEGGAKELKPVSNGWK